MAWPLLPVQLENPAGEAQFPANGVKGTWGGGRLVLDTGQPGGRALVPLFLLTSVVRQRSGDRLPVSPTALVLRDMGPSGVKFLVL